MRIKIFILLILFVFSVNSWGFSEKDCLKCHKKDKILNGKYIHKPLKKENCLSCHMPHASRYENLLKNSPDKLCETCHKKLFEEAKMSKFVHPPFSKKACIRCHKSHSSNNVALLKSPPEKLCFNCHKKLKKEFKYTHSPFKKGKCLSCHTDHYSNDIRFLKKSGSKICLNCHKLDKKLEISHKFKFTEKNCLNCHNPHGSQKTALLRDTFHEPFAKKECGSCHNKNMKNRDLCLNCHKNIIKSFNKVHNHLLGGITPNPCLLCHNPHVGNTKELLSDAPERLCQQCHFETYKQKQNSLYIHPEWKNCTICHEAHGENNVAMLKGGGNNTCTQCHKTQGKFTHPVGDKVKDPRNGQSITCITCHDTMGTNFKYNLRLSGEGELCLECHKSY